MSNLREEYIKRLAAKRKSSLLLDIIQGKTTLADVSHQFGLSAAQIEWVVV